MLVVLDSVVAAIGVAYASGCLGRRIGGRLGGSCISFGSNVERGGGGGGGGDDDEEGRVEVKRSRWI